ncbi:MAG: S9 family peptidase [Candidatus Eremiobacteraeota bacterium]|nr:S9 family peptidase [Candidatus Eremiobacteraeota bacterium]
MLPLALVMSATATLAATIPPPPPAPPQRPVVETDFGTRVVDPYRYFENMQNAQVQAFFRQQNTYTRSILAMLDPARERLFQRIKQLDATGTSVSSVQLVGSQYFYLRRQPTDNNEKLAVRDVADGAERVLVDPDRLATRPNQHFTINYFLPSLDGKYVAYGISEGGSENSVIHVVETATASVLPDSIDRAKFVGATAWRPDGRSFYYMRYPKLLPGAPQTEAEQRAVNYLHVLGNDPDKDVPVLGFGINPAIALDPNDFSIVSYSPATSYAIGLIAHGVKNEVTMYEAPLSAVSGPSTPWRKIVDVNDEVTGFDVHGDTLYLLTHKNSPRFKLIATSLSNPNVGTARTVVPEGTAVLSAFSVARDAVYVRLLDAGLGRLVRLPFESSGHEGAPTQIALPYDGALQGPVTDPRDDGAAIGLTSWTKSLLWYAVSPNGTLTDTRLKPLAPIDASAYTSIETKARSADGTMVPLSIVFRRGLPLDGTHPAYLEGYGAYGITLDPYFSTTRIAWLERGGVYAVCHTRGGGEYGEAWHQAGMITTKQHTIDDFVGCARYLIAQRYTSPAHLNGEGTSAGGITIGGAITQHPELFAAALDVVGVSDALRSEFSPNGPPNIPEFGTVKDPVGFRALLAMDAYQHVRNGVRYPAVMLITGINDPRVSPWELAKFAARLQQATRSGRPILLRVDYDAGHGFLAASREQSDRLLADQYSFLLWQDGDREFAHVPMLTSR